jgi:hypothetical protein
MGSSEYIIQRFNRMAAVAPHDVPIFIQDEILPGVMGEVERKAPDFLVNITMNHFTVRDRLIKDKIHELYDLQPGDKIRSIEIYDNLIKYEICYIIGRGQYQPVIRPKKVAGGKRRSTRKTKRKRRSTRRLKPRRHTK